MYKGIFKVTGNLIDEANKELFTPFVNCYHLHSATISFNGISYEEDIDFSFIGNKTKWNADFNIESTDIFNFEINYFYIKPDNINILDFLVDGTYVNPAKTKEIISKHYIEGQFSLDNGLYKNAVLNFGTALEGILNKSLTSKKLDKLINDYTGIADSIRSFTIADFKLTLFYCKCFTYNYI